MPIRWDISETELMKPENKKLKQLLFKDLNEDPNNKSRYRNMPIDLLGIICNWICYVKKGSNTLEINDIEVFKKYLESLCTIKDIEKRKAFIDPLMQVVNKAIGLKSW